MPQPCFLVSPNNTEFHFFGHLNNVFWFPKYYCAFCLHTSMVLLAIPTYSGVILGGYWRVIFGILKYRRVIFGHPYILVTHIAGILIA